VISKGIERIAEEIGRALPKIPLLISSGTKQIRLMPKGNHIVLATAGSEPQDLYAAVILFDGERIVNRPFLRSEELARHTWFSILNRSLDLAEVFISLPNKHPLTQSLLRSDSSYLVKQILKERKTAKLPPFFRMAVVTGIKKDISKFSENLKSATTYEVNGPIDIDSSNSKIIIRASLEESSKFVDMLDDVVRLQGLKGKSVFQIRLDPFDL
jgi:primosomal protein N' (replication factor Y)